MEKKKIKSEAKLKKERIVYDEDDFDDDDEEVEVTKAKPHKRENEGRAAVRTMKYRGKTYPELPEKVVRKQLSNIEKRARYAFLPIFTAVIGGILAGGGFYYSLFSVLAVILGIYGATLALIGLFHFKKRKKIIFPIIGIAANVAVVIAAIPMLVQFFALIPSFIEDVMLTYFG